MSKTLSRKTLFEGNLKRTLTANGAEPKYIAELKVSSELVETKNTNCKLIEYLFIFKSKRLGFYFKYIYYLYYNYLTFKNK